MLFNFGILYKVSLQHIDFIPIFLGIPIFLDFGRIFRYCTKIKTSTGVKAKCSRHLQWRCVDMLSLVCIWTRLPNNVGIPVNGFICLGLLWSYFARIFRYCTKIKTSTGVKAKCSRHLQWRWMDMLSLICILTRVPNSLCNPDNGYIYFELFWSYFDRIFWYF
jgi:hypothetical protein